jgi:hypothetical protein
MPRCRESSAISFDLDLSFFYLSWFLIASSVCILFIFILFDDTSLLQMLQFDLRSYLRQSNLEWPINGLINSIARFDLPLFPSKSWFVDSKSWLWSTMPGLLLQ